MCLYMTYLPENIASINIASKNIASKNIMAASNEDVNDTSSAAGASDSEQSRSNANYECNICLETPKDAVVTLCGHLFW